MGECIRFGSVILAKDITRENGLVFVFGATRLTKGMVPGEMMFQITFQKRRSKMSRSGYSDYCDSSWSLIMWRGRVASATRGKRGQKLLKDLAAALDEMPVKELIENELKTGDGSVCALGALGAKRGLDLESIDPEDYDSVAKVFDIAAPLAQEIVYMNDEFYSESPQERWARMRKWIGELIKKENVNPTGLC